MLRATKEIRVYRCFLAVFLSGVLSALPTLALAQTQGQPENRKPTVQQASDSMLISYVAQNGRYNDHDGVIMNQIIKELAKRANRDHSREVAYALARELEYPSIATWHTEPETARKWYLFAMQLGSIPATYHVGVMYCLGIGVTENPVYGRQLIEWATTRGFNAQMAAAPARYDRNAVVRKSAEVKTPTSSTAGVDPSDGAAVLGAVALFGLAALLLSGSSSSDTNSSSSSRTFYNPPEQKSCTVTDSTWVSQGNGRGHYQKDTRWAWGAECY